MAEKPADYPPLQPQVVQPPPSAGYQPPQPAYQPLQPGYQPAGYQPAQQPGYQPAPQTTVVLTQPTIRDPMSCAFCGGIRRDRFTLIGIVFALIFFPFGIICCFFMMEKRCTACGR